MRRPARTRRLDRPRPTDAMNAEPPPFANQFLAATHEAFAPRVRRWRRLSVGRHDIELDPLRPVYWLIVYYQPSDFCGVILTVESDQTAIVTIRNTRGRNLLNLRGVRLPDDPKAIIELFEWTTDKAHFLRGEMDAKSRLEFIDRWNSTDRDKRLTGSKRL